MGSIYCGVLGNGTSAVLRSCNSTQQLACGLSSAVTGCLTYCASNTTAPSDCVLLPQTCQCTNTSAIDFQSGTNTTRCLGPVTQPPCTLAQNATCATPSLCQQSCTALGGCTVIAQTCNPTSSVNISCELLGSTAWQRLLLRSDRPVVPYYGQHQRRTRLL